MRLLIIGLLFLSMALATSASSMPTPRHAWQWYHRSDTQCVVNHEGAWNSPSISPHGVYAGRFQMDYSFETETPFGRWAERRWGRAWNWPPKVQVLHAYEVWLYAGWSRWPTYYHYCT